MNEGNQSNNYVLVKNANPDQTNPERSSLIRPKKNECVSGYEGHPIKNETFFIV